jgi:altronate hydrolase
MPTYPLTDKAIVLRAEDDVAIAKVPLAAGTVLDDGGQTIEVRTEIRPGHKVARHAVHRGDPVRRYGQVIGFATADIQVGDHVHTQNLGIGELGADRYEVGVDVRPVSYYPPAEMRYFDGYKRQDGRVGTRNYVAVISTVNCAASVSQFVKERFRDVPREYPHVDGVLAITHKSGCGTQLHGEDHVALQRVLAGYAKHPNVAAYILVGLGCEVNQAAVMVERQKMAMPGPTCGGQPVIVTIQEEGGVRKTVERAVTEVAKLLPRANEARRTKQPVSEILLATNCGGSDGNSGITANPALGWAVDELVRYGGTGVLAETPEIYGAEHLLIRRAVNEGVAKKLIDRYKWWEWYCRGIDAMDNNPAPGNKAGGLTTVFEKSLGGVAKGGTTPMTDVFLYGEPITTRGFVFMDTPGHDPVSITGLVAGGCNVICFTTGRGSVFGAKPVPSIKLATNSIMYRHMEEDMDINCGVIVEGTPLAAVGRQIFEEIVAVASGKRSKSELAGVGEEEFAPWIIGPVM